MSASAGASASVIGLTKRYGAVDALRGVSFDLAPGEVLGLLGPNGAGKSTTLGVLLGFLRPNGGEASLFGGSPDDPAARRRVGYLPESPVFAEHHHADSLLGFHAELLGIASADRKHAIETALTEAGLASVRRRRVRALSKGMLQRLGLAVALLGSPELLVLDEPTSNLDPVGRRELCQLIRARRARGVAVIFASHVLPEIEATCDRVIVLREGQIALAGTLSDLRGTSGAPRTLEEVFFEAIGDDNQDVP